MFSSYHLICLFPITNEPAHSQIQKPPSSFSLPSKKTDGLYVCMPVQYTQHAAFILTVVNSGCMVTVTVHDDMCMLKTKHFEHTSIVRKGSLWLCSALLQAF